MLALSTLSHIIPPPAYIKMPSSGLDISDTSVKFITFAPDYRSGAHLHISHWGEVEIPVGAIERGQIIEPGKVVKALTEVKRLCGGDSVRVSLPEEHAYLFKTELKRNTPFKEIRGLLEFRLEENVPLSPRDAFFDYDILEEETDKRKLHVSVTAYARETISTYYEACRAAGFRPLSFEIEAQAIARAVVPKRDLGTYMIVDFGKSRTGVGIVHKGHLLYTSTIEIGGISLSDSLRAIVGEKPEGEYTELKNSIGVMRHIGENEIYDALVAHIAELASELTTRIGYWNNREDASDDSAVQEIILCGGSANLNGLPEYLSSVIGLPTSRANVWQNAFSLGSYIPEIDRAHSYGYTTAIGLALTQFMHTDL